MKVLFYLLDGDTNASSTHRALQFVPLLRAYGIEASVSRPVPRGFYARLVEQGRGKVAEKALYYGLFLANRLVDVLRSPAYDVVVIQRDLFPFGPPLLERLLWRLNPRLVFDTDDPVYLRPSFTPDTVFQRLRRFDKVAEVVRHARWVSAATEPIAAWARQHNERVSVLPVALDPAPYEAARRFRVPRRPGDPFVIGWAGTGGSVQYLEGLAPVFRRLAERHAIEVRAVSGAWQRIRLPGVPFQARPWRPDTYLSEMAGFDVGLAPLLDEPFEREKFPGKALQYMALSVPVLGSRLGTIREVVREGENGLLATTAPEWEASLEYLMADEPERQRLGQAGYATFHTGFTAAHVAPHLARGLYRAAGRELPAKLLVLND